MYQMVKCVRNLINIVQIKIYCELFFPYITFVNSMFPNNNTMYGTFILQVRVKCFNFLYGHI